MSGPAVERRDVRRDGVRLAVEVAGEGPVVVLAHGFPELAFSWRHQVPALVEAGYTVATLDQRGYGRSERPAAIEAYDVVQLGADLLAVLDELGVAQGSIVGHDWGAVVAWQLALLAPDRVRAVVGMSVPFLPRPSVPPLARLAERFRDRFFYILYFQEPGVADAELGADPARTMRMLLAGRPVAGPAEGGGFLDRLEEPAELPGWLSQAELDHYVAEFTRTGFTGGLNWYRNLDRNWALTAPLAGAHVRCPSRFIAGAADPVLSFSPPAAGAGLLDDHRGDLLLEGAGHWVQQERPAEVNAALIEFLDDVHDRRTPS